jgi:hypothetical protein
MYKHKLFARHPRHLLKSKGSFKTYTKSHKSGKGILYTDPYFNPMDDYLLSLVKGVKHGMKLSKKEHSGGRARKKIDESGKSPLKFVR